MSKVLIVGDLHISDRTVGSHKDYWGNCLYALNMVTQSIKEKGITHLVLLGDWFGVGETGKCLHQRKHLSQLINILNDWRVLLNGNIYTLKGNHDFSSTYTDYEFLLSVGCMQSVPYFDIENCRIHLFNYGEEVRPIELGPKHNIGCFHNNLTVEGQTTWYIAPDGIPLDALKNLKGLELAIAGHIHNPSPRLISTTIEGEQISLFYPGCPTRPRYEEALWDSCYGVVISSNALGDVMTDIITYNLPSVEDTFNLDGLTVNEESNVPTLLNKDAMLQILSGLNAFNIKAGGDYVTQLKVFGGADAEAIEMASKYIQESGKK